MSFHIEHVCYSSFGACLTQNGVGTTLFVSFCSFSLLPRALFGHPCLTQEHMFTSTLLQQKSGTGEQEEAPVAVLAFGCDRSTHLRWFFGEVII